MKDEYELAGDPDEPESEEEEVIDPPSRTTGKPAAPLPRMWKVDPEPEEEKPKPKKKRDVPPHPSEKPKKKLEKGEMEETPTLETYEGRTRVRMAVGILGALGLLLIGYLIVNAIGGSGDDIPDAPADEEPMIEAQVVVAKAVPKGEDEAKLLMTQAKQVAKTGKPDQVLALLQKIAKTYPLSTSAKEAKAAIDRSSQGLPMFPDGEAIVATPVEPMAKNATEQPTPVVSVNTPSTPGTAKADLTLPVTPPEPSKEAAVATNYPSMPNVPANARPLPVGFKPRVGTLYHQSGWPIQITSDRDGATMMFIAGTTFTMGRDDGPLSEAPAHQVTLSSYYIDKHEVTNRQYAIFMRETSRRGELVGSEEMPVTRVSAVEAKAYADWSSKRLPSEAQWELAARSPDGRLFPAGADAPIWARPRQPKQVDPVMSFENDQSPYGVFDLAGNVAEWTNDWFDSKYYQSLRGQTVVNPVGPQSSKARPPLLTIKGGSKTWQTSWREGVPSTSKLPYVGFRCTLPVEFATQPFEAAPGAPAGTPAAPGGVVPF